MKKEGLGGVITECYILFPCCEYGMLYYGGSSTMNGGKREKKKSFLVVVSAGAEGQKTLYVLTGVYQTIVLQAAQAPILSL